MMSKILWKLFQSDFTVMMNWGCICAAGLEKFVKIRNARIGQASSSKEAQRDRDRYPASWQLKAKPSRGFQAVPAILDDLDEENMFKPGICAMQLTGKLTASQLAKHRSRA